MVMRRWSVPPLGSFLFIYSCNHCSVSRVEQKLSAKERVAININIILKYLHVAIIEDYEECLVASTSDGLRKQVAKWLAKNSLLVPTDEEWAVLILALEDRPLPTASPLLTPISYYKTKSRLED